MSIMVYLFGFLAVCSTVLTVNYSLVWFLFFVEQKKAKGLKVFNSQPAVNDVIISEDVYQAIKRNKLDIGLEFVLVGA